VATEHPSPYDAAAGARAEARIAATLAQPVAWLSLAVAGVLLVCVGAGIEAYRHGHGAATDRAVSASSPGALVALGGLALVAAGLLAALSILLLQEELSPSGAIRRGAAILAAWTLVAGAGAGALTYLAVAGTTIGDDGSASPSAAGGAAVLHGRLTIDGRPLDAQFLGARVIRDGLPAACQQTIPAVPAGAYRIGVLSDAEAPGCGAAGARIVLWTNVDGQTLFSRDSAPWPKPGGAASFDSAFSTTDPKGAARPATEFFARVTRAGVPVPAGTAVRAFIGDTLCASSSIRTFDGDVGAIVIVAGPQRAGCAEGGRITFDIGGTLAAETATNDLGSGGDEHNLDLTIR